MIESNKIYYNNNGELAIFFSEEVVKQLKEKFKKENMCSPGMIRYIAIHNSNEMFETFELSEHSFINKNDNGTVTLFDKESRCDTPFIVAVFTSEWSIRKRD